MPEPVGSAATVWVREVASPHGLYYLAATAAGLCRVTIPGQSLSTLTSWLDRTLPSADLTPDDGRLSQAVHAMATFWDGAPLPPLPVDLRGTAFQRSVWQAVQRIPFGETRSYAEVAREIGHPLASRAVGSANAANPLPFVVPCHRVVGADGSIKGFPGSVITRLMLLQLEGAR